MKGDRPPRRASRTARGAPGDHLDTLSLRTLDIGVHIRCEEPGTGCLLAAHYERMRHARDRAGITYGVARRNGHLLLRRDGQRPLGPVRQPGELVFLLDQDLIVQVQRQRRDLYFVHGAALGWADRTVMLVARPGGGKSTLTWALVHHGFRYLSDELAPVELSTLAVHPYPRALMLKSVPPPAYPLPDGVILTARGVHVPPAALPTETQARPAPLAAIFFLRYRPGGEPAVRRLGPAETSARLYANTLNALAHAGDGLEAGIHIARRTAGFELVTADLPTTCALVQATLRDLSR